MKILTFILELLDTRINAPKMLGGFHILWLFITAAATILLCRYFREERYIDKVVFITSVTAIVLEVYKQINYTFSVQDGVIVADYQWYAFPFQFCSMPMYVGLLASLLKKGRVKNALYAFLGTYGLFAGLCVMIYPNDVFCSILGINIQTMICHGSMVAIGIYLLYSGRVKPAHKTALKAMAVFAIAVGTAAILNELAFLVGIVPTETFNMFFISPHCEPSLPVYSLVQSVVPFPFCLIIYILAFSLAAYIILLVSMLIKKTFSKKQSITYTEKELLNSNK